MRNCSWTNQVSFHACWSLRMSQPRETPRVCIAFPLTPAPEFVCVFRGLLIRWTLGGKSPPVVVKGTWTLASFRAGICVCLPCWSFGELTDSGAHILSGWVSALSWFPFFFVQAGSRRAEESRRLGILCAFAPRGPGLEGARGLCSQDRLLGAIQPLL